MDTNHVPAGTTESVKPITFSVIMPCYNSQDYVENALKSIQSQSYPHWELVAINDGSQDRTLSILTAYAQADSRIRIFSKENGGYISAVNCGLEKISGDYFLLLGSDDTLDTALFSKLASCASHGMPDCIAFRTVSIEHGNVMGIDPTTDFPGSVSMFETTFAAYADAYPAHAAILFSRDTSKCFKRTCLGSLRYFGRYGYDADGIFSMLLCHGASSFAAIAENGYYWTLRGDSLSGRKSFFAQDQDRVMNWILFYRQLLTLPAQEITASEKSFLYYFLGILNNTIHSAASAFAQYSLIKEAASVIRDMVTLTGYQLSLPVEHRLLLRSPLLWTLLMSLPKPLLSAIENRNGPAAP